MTDTTNRAEALRIALEVIRDNRHLNNGVTLQDVAAEALTALDALTRELEAHRLAQPGIRGQIVALTRELEDQERSHLKTIDQRDAAEDALGDAYALVTGNQPEWSNYFGYADAMEDITNALDALTREAAPSQCKNCDHLWDELRDEEKLKFRAESERDEARATIAAQSARIADLEAQGTIDRDEQGRLREELRVMADGKAHAIAEATRHFDTVLEQSARIATLEEALGFYASLDGWDQGRHTGKAVYAVARTALAPKEAQG